MECRSLAVEQLQRAVNSTAAMAIAVAIAVILTIVAVGYQPPDPVFQVSRSMARLFNSLHNATFEIQDSVVVTGEDAVAASPSAAPAQIVGANSTDPAVRDPAKCDPGTRSINCSDPGVLAAIEIANKKKFPDMGSFEYGPVVRGSSGSRCDISWKFTTRGERSARLYRDYREYSLLVNSSCDYVVEKIGNWHSGKNARWPQAESINDTIFNRSANTFWSGSKYLYYSGGGDQCKSMSQYLWSLLCALGEARYLKRTLVMELELCLSAADNPGAQQDQPGKDFRLYFDYEHLQQGAAVVNQKQFLKRWLNWNKKHPHSPVSYRLVDDTTKVSAVELAGDASSIIWRRFEPSSYWYRVCEGEAEKVIQRPWELVWKSKRLMNVVNAICGEMEWDFAAVHVVRGRKAENKDKWPNLDHDTMPEEIMEKLDGLVESGSRLYVATNEMLDGYFDKLRAKYRLYLLSDFSSLWAPNSQWYNDTKALLGPKSRSKLEFDGYMRAEVDSEIFLRAKNRVETFGQLTSDCKHGINTC